MVSQPSSQKAMITSCALRFSERSADRKLVLASCWVNGAAALAHAARLDVGDHRPADRSRVDAPVVAKAAVLDRDEGSWSQRIELCNIDRLVLDRAAPGDRPAFCRDQQHRRIVERLQRAATAER